MTAINILAGFVIITIMIVLLIQYLRPSRERYFCDGCNRYLGTGRDRPKVCPHCGDFRYYIRPEETS